MTRTASILASFLVLSACGPVNTGESFGGSEVLEPGECEGSPYERADSTASVWAEVDGSTILVHLDDLTANCCPSPDADITLEDDLFTVDFFDVTDDDMCDCECIMDFTVAIDEVSVGTYDIDVFYYGTLLDELTVMVS